MAKSKENYAFVLCIENKECDDLEKRKIYRMLPDAEAEKEGYVRVIDESGEDYLYPRSYFINVKLPREAQEAETKLQELERQLVSRTLAMVEGQRQAAAEILGISLDELDLKIRSYGL